MQLHLMSDKGLKNEGAVCLDGSDAGFYFSPAKDSANWLIYFTSGGWCYDEVDCLIRSQMSAGSSKFWGKPGSTCSACSEGVLSDNCQVNPDFCRYNRVFLPYCDGASFSGNRDDPVSVEGRDGAEHLLYFRGRRILDAVVSTLISDHGLADATDVALTGSSAGGLAAILHADRVGGLLEAAAPGLRRFKVLPLSGFFLNHANVLGQTVFPSMMRNLFDLANASHGVNADCVAAVPEEAWRCMLANDAYTHVKSPIFVVNSALDLFQTDCIYTALMPESFPSPELRNGWSSPDGGASLGSYRSRCGEAPGWGNCSYDPDRCTAQQLEEMNQYMNDFVDAVRKHERPGNGAFLYECKTHGAETESENLAWSGFEIDGVSMQRAVSDWWNSKGGDPGGKHWHLPGRYRAKIPRQSNPSCARHAPYPLRMLNMFRRPAFQEDEIPKPKRKA